MSNFATTDGVDLYYEESGDGRPLILLGGWTMSTEWWRRQVPDLSQEMRTIAMDMRSYGRSEKTRRGHRLSRYAADLRELILHLDLQDVVVCGWSMGASTIWSYVDLFGTDKLAGAIFVDQTPKILTDETWKTGLGPDFTLSALDGFLGNIESDPEAFFQGFIPSMFVTPPPEEEQSWMLDAVRKMPTEDAVEVLQDHCCQDWRDVLGKVDIPALVITGGQSSLFPPESGVYQATEMPSASHEIFESSSHAPFYEEPERFNDSVRNFVGAL